MTATSAWMLRYIFKRHQESRVADRSMSTSSLKNSGKLECWGSFIDWHKNRQNRSSGLRILAADVSSW